MTFSTVYKQLRQEKKLSMNEVARNAKLHVSTIWKAETDIQLPRGKTMRRMCLEGLGVIEGSEAWERLNTAWLAERTESGLSPADQADRLFLHEIKNRNEAKAFAGHLKKLSPREFTELAKAVSRPEVMALLPALNALYEK